MTAVIALEEERDVSECPYCKGEPEPGFIETSNNGPIVACPWCNKDYDTPQRRREREYEAAMAQVTLRRHGSGA
jgi:hypothetical protein